MRYINSEKNFITTDDLGTFYQLFSLLYALHQFGQSISESGMIESDFTKFFNFLCAKSIRTKNFKITDD